MSKSTKAVLLSALVFPGSGQLYLKRFLPAAILAGAAFISLYLIISKILERALQITDKIQLGEVQLDATAITELLSKQSAGSETQILDIAGIALIVSWLISIIDAYRAGRRQEKENTTSSSP